jgi:HD-like signal output (HDOD) protein
MDENILRKIKSLPPLDDTILKIQRICTDKNSSLGDLVKVVESDPMLTANILKSSNSPLYGFSREIKSISHAVSLFGMATVRGFALSSAIKQSMKINLTPYNITNAGFLEISTYQSALMFNWYSKVDRSMLDILVPASFLMEVGKVVLANVLMDKKTHEPFLEKIKTVRTPKELSELEKETHGIANEEVTAKIFEQWNLEVELVEAIRYSVEINEAPEHIRPLSLALNVVKTAVNVFDQLTPLSVANATEVAKDQGFDVALFEAAVKKVSP